MQACVPGWGHTRVHAFELGQVTFARLPSPISMTLLLERSLGDVVGVKVGQGECHIMTDVELGVVREECSRNLVRLSSVSSIRRASLRDRGSLTVLRNSGRLIILGILAEIFQQT